MWMARAQGHPEPRHVPHMNLRQGDTRLEPSEALRGRSVPQEYALRLVYPGIAEGGTTGCQCSSRLTRQERGMLCVRE